MVGPAPEPSDDTTDPQAPFASAEAWLAERGVTRDPIRVAPPAPVPDERPAAEPQEPRPPSAREAHRLASEAPPGAPAPAGPSDDDVAAGRPLGNLEDEVDRALAFIRRSTAMQPAAEDRLRRKLADRDTPRVVADQALARARAEGLVDDRALAAALVEERRRRGHAVKRIRQDLRRRGLPDDLVDEQLAQFDREDPEAAAFDVARRKAASYGALEPETAFRRLVGFLARRGYSEGLARKVARQVIYTDREDERTAGH